MKPKQALALAAGAVLLIPASAFSQSADNLLERVASRYRTLKSYYFEGVVKMRMQAAGFNQEFESPGVLALQKADSASSQKTYFKARIAGNDMLEVSDGSKTWNYLGSIKQYTEEETAPRGTGLGTESDADENAPAATGNFDIGRYEHLPQKVKNPKLLRVGSVFFGKETKKITPCYVVQVEEMTEGEPPGTTILPSLLYIDTARLLVLSEEHQAVMKQFGQFDSASMDWNLELTVARLDEKLPDSLFSFQPPAGARRVKEFEVPGYKRANLKGKKAADFTLRNVEGEEFSLKGVKGKTVLLDFWASWCTPCRKEMPHLEKLHQEFKDKGLVVLGVNVESREAASNFMSKNGFHFPTVVDPDGSVQQLYKVEAFPTLFVIGRDGKIKAHFVGAAADEDLRRALADAGVK